MLCRALGGEKRGTTLEKTDQSPVTVADFGSQALIQRKISTTFPGATFVSEEDSIALRQPENRPLLENLTTLVNRVRPATTNQILDWLEWGKAKKNADYFWTLDPIDGTRGFIRGDQYAVCLCLIVEGELKVAVLGCPRLSTGREDGLSGVIFGAVAGEGAFQLNSVNETPVAISVSTIDDVTRIRYTESVESANSSQPDSARLARHLGFSTTPWRLDSQVKYAVVARGDAEVYLRLPTNTTSRENIWDHAGGALLVSEAGGRVTDIEGRPLDFSRILSLQADINLFLIDSSFSNGNMPSHSRGSALLADLLFQENQGE
jgi:3'(2'), 5'-bisphosphate nucleotidase